MQCYVILLLKICVCSIYSFDFLSSSALIKLCLSQVVLSTIVATATLLVFMVITNNHADDNFGYSDDVHGDGHIHVHGDEHGHGVHYSGDH